MAIAPDIADIYCTSLGTLSRFVENMHKTFVLIVDQDHCTINEARQMIQRQCVRLGITETYFADGFDYSSVTQQNADLINSFIRVSKPSIIIMPFWRSPNHTRKILAKTSLIASRQIGTVLMYEVDNNSPEYTPAVIIPIPPGLVSIKQQYQEDFCHTLHPSPPPPSASSHSSSKRSKKEDPLTTHSDAHNSVGVNINSNDLSHSNDNTKEQNMVGQNADKNENNREYGIPTNSRGNHISELNVEMFMSHRMILVDDFGL